MIQKYKAARFVVLSIFHEICYFPYANNTYSSNGNSQILVFYVSHLQQNKSHIHNHTNKRGSNHQNRFSVFVLYATSCANTVAQKSKRKTLTAPDVFTAMEEMEFETFLEPLKDSLEVL